MTAKLSYSDLTIVVQMSLCGIEIDLSAKWTSYQCWPVEYFFRDSSWDLHSRIPARSETFLSALNDRTFYKISCYESFPNWVFLFQLALSGRQEGGCKYLCDVSIVGVGVHLEQLNYILLHLSRIYYHMNNAQRWNWHSFSFSANGVIIEQYVVVGQPSCHIR